MKLSCPGRTYAVCHTRITEHVGPVNYGEFFEKKPLFRSSHFDLQVAAAVDPWNEQRDFGVEIPPKCGKACKVLLFVGPTVVAVLVARHITRTPPSPVITFGPPRVTPPPGVVSP